MSVSRVSRLQWKQADVHKNQISVFLAQLMCVVVVVVVGAGGLRFLDDATQNVANVMHD